ncbi:Molybdopterin or thiamine biosynthesis adenylyltransferase [Micromonospora rhizosphaerae]|uniref:Molybdopterin or thiamine biosynthesis adenylyltransferase n=1 Tax=Micromonospora rhizosphaerae TaxID=568872 RepID=A0A1C6SA79_9ACTN|nr:ThiF family adenylyltransferase [Micromonospora rhizosphaerae]SCL26251.1 Molybdopterin or thiamine biosynthesis adenylyltransferase [Micromonospora rhizosphaerae]
MTRAWERELTAEREVFRRVLARADFTGEDDTLRGPLRWYRCGGEAVTATIEVTMTAAYPFAPPQVRVLDAGIPLTPTFHRERDGALCLWPADTPVENAPWCDPARLLRRVAAWLRQTEAGWPGDSACDLERYLPAAGGIVLYDLVSLATVHGCVRTRATPDSRCVTITGKAQAPPVRPNRRHRGTPTIGRRHRHLAWVADIGEVTRPIEDWASLRPLLGGDAGQIGWLIGAGVVEYLVLRYRRGSSSGLLALTARPSATRRASIEIQACEAADTSVPTRLLRAGTATAELADRRVAVVGAGAVGSFVADLLFRQGVRKMTLFDGQLLRPGNLVRHLAGEPWVGHPKVVAVTGRLADLGFDTTGVDPRHDRLTTPEQAVTLLRKHDLVVDATGDARASALLAWAGSTVQRSVITVCVERHGGIIRVDRFPLRGSEQHHPPVPGGRGDQITEHGCDDPVSLTPPASVIAAAQLACRAAIDDLTRECALPATLLEVIEPQEAPDDVRGLNLADSRPGKHV